MDQDNIKLSRSEMLELVQRLMRGEGTEAEINADVALFNANCLHPNKSDLIFWPHGFPHDPKKPEPTAEEIVEKALSPDNVIRL